nr:guanylate kinase [Burkholderiales bacterium]
MATGNNIFVISAPSGAGKSSLVKALCNQDPHIKTSISHTTRPIRPGEKNGIDYFFIQQTEFEQLLKDKQFIEYALVYGNYYGTHIATIEKLRQQGFDIILEIDYQGAMQIRQLFPKAVLIYILPPNLEELKKRLIARNTDSAATIT